MKGKYFFVVLFFLTILLVPDGTGANSRLSGIINIGCDSEEAYRLTERLAENFMDSYPRVQIFIENISPEKAIDKLKKGSLDIVITMDDVNFRNTTPRVLAKKGIAFIVNDQNTKDDLTLNDLASIYQGKAKTWNDLGLNAVLSRRLDVVGLKDSSHTQQLFTELFSLNSDFEPSIVLNSDQEVIKYVAENRYALGYISLNSLTRLYGSVKLMSIDGVLPSLDNIFNNYYNLCDTYYLVTETVPFGVVKRFVDFITDEGNTVLQDYGLLSYREVLE